MVSQTFGSSLFCCYCCRQGRVEGKMESDQISICYLNSLFKVNMDFYHIKPKLMSQRFYAWILLANRKIILRDGRLKELFLRRTWGTGCCKSAGPPVVAPRRPTSALGMGVVLVHVGSLTSFCSLVTLDLCPAVPVFQMCRLPKLQKHIDRHLLGSSVFLWTFPLFL